MLIDYGRPPTPLAGSIRVDPRAVARRMHRRPSATRLARPPLRNRRIILFLRRAGTERDRAVRVILREVWGEIRSRLASEDRLYMARSFFIVEERTKRSALRPRPFAASSPPLRRSSTDFIPTKLTGFSPLKRTAGGFASRASHATMPSDAWLADWFALLAVCVTAAAAVVAAEAAAAAASPICVRSRVATPEGRPVYNAESTAN